jgi:hypothetical protein
VIGDLLGWLAVAGFVAMVAWGVIRSLKFRRARKAQAQGQRAS